MRRYPSVVFALVVLAALLAVPLPGNAVPPAAPGFITTENLPGSTNGSESSVAIPYEGQWRGRRFVAWQVPGERVLSDDGVTWGTSNTPDPSAGGDMTNAIDAAGTFYMGQFCGDPDPSGLHNCLYRSYNGGTTFAIADETILIDNHPGAADRPWIDVYPSKLTKLNGTPSTPTASDTTKTRVHNLFHTFTPDDQVYVTSSADGGETFGPPIPIALIGGTAFQDSECNTVPSDITVDQENGDVFALWLSGDGIVDNHVTGCNYSQIGPFNKAWVARSTDGGATWEAANVWTGAFDTLTKLGDNANKLFGSLSIDTAGQLHVLLSVRKNDDPLGYALTETENDADSDLLLLTSPDRGAHWTLPVEVNQVNDGDTNPLTVPHSYFYPWVAAGAKGAMHTIFYRSLTSRPNAVTNTWFVGGSFIRNANAQYTAGPNATYVGGGPEVSPEVLYTANSIHGNGVTDGGICTFGLFCSVTGGNRDLLDTNAVELDPAGGANPTWTADANPPARHLGFACQSSGPSAYDGANAPEPFAGGQAVLNGCYGPADMNLTKSGPSSIAPGAQITYTLTVTNTGTTAGPSTTSAVVLTDTLPAGVSFVSATPQWPGQTCSHAAGVVTCKLGTFPGGTSTSVSIVGTVSESATGTLHNTASVLGGTADPDTADNAASADTSVNTGPVCTVLGTVGNDVLKGGTGPDTICGLEGNDVLYGFGNDDTLLGGPGNDQLFGGPGADTMLGEAGNDQLSPGPGSDPLVDGGSNNDGVNYSDATAAVVVDLGAQTATGGSDTDTLAGIENAGGGAGADQLIGSAAANQLDGRGGADDLDGLGGADVLTGGAGLDSLDGGGGTDIASYRPAPNGATVSLTSGSASNDGYGTTDTLTAVEDLHGSDGGGDSLTGSGGPNKLYGFAGADQLFGMAGNDHLDGGAGTDTCDGGGGNNTIVNCP